MTREDTIKILSVLRGAYPQFYRDISRQEAESTIALWTDMFTDEPFPLVAMAVKALIASDTKGFPPVIGQVKAQIGKIMSPNEMTELEAWAIVSKALKNSTYGADEEFRKLPPVIQHLVGSPSQLRSWAAMDADTVESVIGSNFQRSYKARAASEREYLALPGQVRQFIDGVGMGMPQLSEMSEAEMNSYRQKRIEAVSHYDTRKTEEETK